MSIYCIYDGPPSFAGVWVAPSHGENRGSSPLGSANKINDLLGRDLISVPKVSPGTGAQRFNWITHPRTPRWGATMDLGDLLRSLGPIRAGIPRQRDQWEGQDKANSGGF
jgi:hypothetical protein